MAGKPKPLVSRVAALVTIGDECWDWQGFRDHNGYGICWVRNGPKNRRRIAAHRVMYELVVGPIPDGLTLDHLCRNRRCVRPAHLEPVTIGVNVRRGIKGVLTTHCPQGHPYNEVNTYVHPVLHHRTCRTCRRDGMRRLKEIRRG